MIILCDRCQKQYYMRPSHYKRYNVHFCSRECFGLSERGENNPAWKDNNQICLICKKEFKPFRVRDKNGLRYTRFCSRKCAQKDKSNKRSFEVECVICKKNIRVKLVHKREVNCCSLECSYKLHSQRMKGSGNSNWRKGIGNLPWSYEFNKELKRKITTRDGGVCKMCGLNREQLNLKSGGKRIQIQVHHIDYDKENNKENNLISLCNYCHGRVNYNKEKWKPILLKILQG